MKSQYILLSLCLVLAGCSYLDLEPEKKGTLQEVFEDRTSAEKFLYGCYGYLPASNDFNGEPQVWGAGDEVALTSQWGTDWHWAKAAHTGQISAAEPLYNYWSHHKSKKQPSRCAAYDLYGGIRQCYTFIDMVDGVPNASDGEKARWKAEARFLVAYFHYSLLRLYGPICLVEGIIPNDAPEEVYYPTRRPYDECVGWIARKFDEAAGELKASRATRRWTWAVPTTSPPWPSSRGCCSTPPARFSTAIRSTTPISGTRTGSSSSARPTTRRNGRRPSTRPRKR